MCIKEVKNKLINQLTYFREDFDVVFKWMKQNKWKTFIGFSILILIGLFIFLRNSLLKLYRLEIK
jgi:hypothetical protein